MVLRAEGRIILLFLLLIVICYTTLSFLRYSEGKRARLLFQDKVQEENVLFDKIIKLKGSSLETFVNDYTFWDDMVRFVRTGDKKWAHDNIDISFPSYTINAAWVYKTDCSLVYSTNTLEDASLKEIPLAKEAVQKLFTHGYFHNFFIPTSKGLMEIRSAPIQPTADSKRITPPQGYFFAGRLWDEKYTAELSSLTESTIKILPAVQSGTAETNQEKGIIIISRTLTDWDGKPLMQVYARSNYPVLREIYRLSNEQFIFTIIFSSVTLALLILFFTYWVNKPLASLSRSLHTEDATPLINLRNNKTEFGELATLIAQFFEQKAKLTEETTRHRQIEETLIESEEIFRTIIENINIGIYRLAIERDEHGPYGRLVQANPALVKILGYESTDSFKGVHIADHYESPEDRKFIMEEIMKKGIVKNREFRLRKKDGTPLWASVTGKAHYDEHGNILWVDGIIEDITEHKQMEEEREKLIQALQEALNNIKTLSGLLPICASCKKVRDDQGYWTQIEAYVSDHSEAEFSHGLCPDCAKKYYDELAKLKSQS
jgi:PAS domain S-box-containing protein